MHSRGTRMLQENRNSYELRRISRLDLNEVEQPLVAAVRAVLQNYRGMQDIIMSLKPLREARRQAALGGMDSPSPQVSNVSLNQTRVSIDAD